MRKKASSLGCVSLLSAALFLSSFESHSGESGAANTCDLVSIALQRKLMQERPALEKRGIARMPYSTKKVQEADKKIDALEKAALERLSDGRSALVPEDVSKDLAKLKGASVPSDPYVKFTRSGSVAPYLSAVRQSMDSNTAEAFLKAISQADSRTQQKFISRLPEMAGDPMQVELKRLGEVVRNNLNNCAVQR